MENYLAAIEILYRLKNSKEPKPLLNPTTFIYAAFLVADETNIEMLKKAFPKDAKLVSQAALNLIANLTRRQGKPQPE